MNSYHLHQLTINNVAIVCDSIEDNPNITTYLEAGGGSSIATISGRKTSAPILQGSTRDVKAILDAVGLTGLALTGVSTAKVVQYWAKMADGYGYASGTAHKTLTMLKCLVVIESISARGAEPAVVNFRIHEVYDGTNAPFVIASGVALPTLANLGNLWTLGKAHIGGTDYETQGWTLNLGPDVETMYKDGEVFPSQVHINRYAMNANIDSKDAALASLSGLVEDSVLYLQKQTANDDTRVAAATEEHISFTIAKGNASWQRANFPWPSSADMSLLIDVVFNGTDAAIVLDTTAAIA